MIETGKELAAAVKKIATSYKTLYVMGCFGAPLKATLNRKKRETPPVPAKVTGEVEAHIIALACGEPPKVYSKWTLRLLAEKTVELGYIESVSHSTVSSVLKKMNVSLI